MALDLHPLDLGSDNLGQSCKIHQSLASYVKLLSIFFPFLFITCKIMTTIKYFFLPELSKVDRLGVLLFPASSGVRSLVVGPSSSDDSESESGLDPGITFLLHTGHVFFLFVSQGSIHLQ